MLPTHALSIAVLAGVALMSGCAATSYEQLVPSVKTDRPNHTAKSISVGSVTTSDQPDWNRVLANVSKETFREALIETLRRSQLFETVTSAPNGAYRLSAEIIAERMRGTFTNTISVFIRYELELNGRLTWSENILSQGELSPQDVLLGAERHRKLQTDAFRDNLAELVEKLRAAIGEK